MMFRDTQIMDPHSLFEVEVQESDMQHIKEQEESNHTENTYDVITDSDDCDIVHWSSRRSVHFAVTVKKHPIENLDYYTQEEMKNCWYTQEEKQKMQSTLSRDIARLNAAVPEARNRSYRGLELLCQEGSERCDVQVFKLVNHVIDEQIRQWDAGFVDQSLIAAVSKSLTAANVGRARFLADQDRKEANKIHRSSERQQRRSNRRNKRNLRRRRRNDPPGASRRLGQRNKVAEV